MGKHKKIFLIVLLSHLLFPCDNDYVDINGSCYYQDDLSILNTFLDNYPIALGFNLFCILILLNGTNLIDGVNNSVVGYFLSVSLILIVLSIKYNLNL